MNRDDGGRVGCRVPGGDDAPVLASACVRISLGTDGRGDLRELLLEQCRGVKISCKIKTWSLLFRMEQEARRMAAAAGAGGSAGIEPLESGVLLKIFDIGYFKTTPELDPD
jgi:hypothetical protein